MKNSLIKTLYVLFHASQNASLRTKRNNKVTNTGDFHVFGGHVYVNECRSVVTIDHIEKLESLELIHEFKSHWYCLTAKAFELCIDHKAGNKYAFEHLVYVKPAYDKIETSEPKRLRQIKCGGDFGHDNSAEKMYKSMMNNVKNYSI